MNLSEHFTLKEMTRSARAAREGIKNDPTPEQIENLRMLCSLVLEPLRAYFDRPINVTSGFRCELVNQLEGGSKKSEHKEGKAGDIEIEGVTPLEVCQAIIMLGLPVGQVIYEFGPDGWCHVSVDTSEKPKREALTAIKVAGKTKYLPGLVA